ncbi:helix-turn-helix domain-containing protein [Skermanella mucosa]|uniref:helix-turn-helix domain-containing protein n=1 Tax=Skermanella mucosa TaxID=1789672 RepID=UPI00192B836B|nr:helix-turn-helix domain-containing protein [Skermanella mucosa]UEM19438.1 helix-turn-helix domain-containing protein [Skermanella mucosa]
MYTIKPIRNDVDHEAALAEVDRLWGAEAGTSQADTLEVLAILIDDYEKTRWPIDRLEPVDAIKAHMEMNGLSQADLSKLFGSESRASEILNRRRRLTVDMIAKLTKAWGLPADWLVQPYEIATKASSERQRPGQELIRQRLMSLKRERSRLGDREAEKEGQLGTRKKTA